MSAIKLFILLLQAVRWVQRYMERRGLLAAAREQALKVLGEGANELIQSATSARAGVSHDPGRVLSDPNNRDTRQG